MPFLGGKFDKADRELKNHFVKMIYINGGEFTKNSTTRFTPTASDSTLFSQSIPKRTFVDPFYISATEITNLDWRKFYTEKVEELGLVKAKEKYYPDTALWLNEFRYTYNLPHAKNYFTHSNFDDFPVVGITWEQANAFCEWKTKEVSRLLAEKGIKKFIEFRLPTENEWEFAAMKKRSENKIEKVSHYGWSEEEMMGHLLDVTNIGEVFDQNGVPLKKYADDGCLYTCKIASYSPNDRGIYDMSGNVSEWTADSATISTTFFQDYDSQTLSTLKEVENEIVYIKNNLNVNAFEVAFLLNKLEHDKKVISKGDIKICKGGSWASGLIYTQPGCRQGINKDMASVKIGFRIATSDVEGNISKYFPKKRWKPRK